MKIIRNGRAGKNKMINKLVTPFFVLMLITVWATGWLPIRAWAYPNVSIVSVRSQIFDEPAHHGIAVETSGITDPNLSFYEVQLKPDTGGPFPPGRFTAQEFCPTMERLSTLPTETELIP